MDLRLDHVRQRLRRKVALLPTPPSTCVSVTYSRPPRRPIQQLRQSTMTQSTIPRAHPSPPSTTQSQHPNFTTMVTEMNVTLRLLTSYDNWSSTFPYRLSTSLDNFVAAIQPPRRSQSCTDHLVTATDRYKSHIQSIVRHEIASTTIYHLRQLHSITADLRDWQLAADTVRRQLNRSHKHLSPATIQPILTHLMTFILDRDAAPNLLQRHFPTLMQIAANDDDHVPEESEVFITLSSTTDSTQPNHDNNIAAAAATNNRSSLINITLDDIEPQPAVNTDVPEDRRRISTEPTDAVHDNIEPEAAAAAAVNDYPSLADIVLHSPEEEPTIDTETQENQVPQSIQLPTSTPTFIIPRSPPFESVDLRRQLPTTPMVLSNTSTPHISHTPTPPLPQRLRPLPNRVTMPPTRRIPTSSTTAPSNRSPALPAIITRNNTSTPNNASTSSSSSHNHPASNSRIINNIRSFHHNLINHWKISPEPTNFTTLVIADSNGKRWLDTPHDWVVYSFGGMKLADVANIMKKSPTVSKFDRIIIHCGRNDSLTSVKDNVNNFVTFLHSVNHSQIFIVPSLLDPQLYEAGLRLFRSIIDEEFNNNAILFDEPELYNRLDTHDTKHYARTTAKHLIQAIIHHLN